MYDVAKKAREAMKSKAKRIAAGEPGAKVDSSSYEPPKDALNADVKTGLRPLSRRAFKAGGKVEGAKAKANLGVTPRSYANAKINRNVKDANEEREGIKHVGGMKKGGRAGYKTDGKVRSDRPVPAETLNKITDPIYRFNLERSPMRTTEQRGNAPDASDLYDAEQLKRLERGYKKGGRTKKAIGGAFGQYLSPVLMLANAVRGDRDDKKKGGRAKKNMGGPMMGGDPRLGMVKDKMLEFGNNPVTPGLKKGGKAEHPDEAMDKALIKKMVKPAARKMMEGGSAKHPDEAMDKALIKKMVKPSARTGKKDGGKSNDILTRGLKDAETLKEVKDSPGSMLYYLVNANDKRGPRKNLAEAAWREMDERNAHREAFNDQDVFRGRKSGGAAKRMNRKSGGQVFSGAGYPEKVPGVVPGGRTAKFGGGAMMGGRGGNPMQNRPMGGGMGGMGGGRPLPGANPLMPPQTGGPGAMMPQTGGPGAMMPQTGGGMPLPTYKKGGRVARKDGGRAKGKTNVNIIISTGKGGQPDGMMAPPPGAPPPGLPVPMPGPQGGPPPAPPMAGPPMPPPQMPPQMPPGGMPPGMPPMARKRGGRTSYKDMTAGSGSGEGRLQKTEIQANKRPERKAGGKVYRSYKDMDAGAGSGLGRLEKTEIQSRKH